MVLSEQEELMPAPRKEIPVCDLERLYKSGKKKFVRYDEGAVLYSMSKRSFQDVAKEAKAVYHIKRMALVNTELIDEYFEQFRDEY